jgi:alpha-D-xyloside xylohydrolase
MRPSVQSIGRSVILVQFLLVTACSSEGPGGTTGGSGGVSSSTGGTGVGGATGAGGDTGGAPPGSGGQAGAGGKTGAGGAGAGGAGAGGATSAGGAGGTAARGGVTGTGTGGRTGGGGATTTQGAGGVVGGAGGTGAGGRLGGAGGAAAGGASGQIGAGGQTGTGGQGGGTPAVACGPAPTCAAPPTSSAYTADATGVTFTVGSGKMKVQVCAANIIRVAYASASTLPQKESLSVSNTWSTPTPFCVAEASGTVTITTACMKAKVATSSGLVSYTDAADTALVAESSKSASGKIQTAFTSTSDEGLFGLGQQPSSTSNRKNSSLHLANSNGNIYIPVLVSSKGYGLFWDNPSAGDFSSNGTTTSYTSASGNLVDYYFFYGPSIDQVIAAYRTTTGPAPLFPKWAYGLFQSKDHYASQTEVTNVMNGYRNGKIPVDCIVQDWNYWDPYSWGSHIMDPSRYKDPKGLLTSMHTNNIHGMISIWPEYQQMSNPPAAVDGMNDQDNFNALNAMTSPTKALYTSGGSHHFYDTFNAAARTLIYQQIYDRLLGKYGWDGIWADNTEPQAYPDSVDVNSQDTALGKGSTVINAYPLQHSKALYEGWRKVGPTGKRVYILTRSAWAGIQRYSASEWSGDIQADQGTYVKQIPAGLSYALSGMPYWTTDIGGYFGTPSEELFTRWFQFGAFCSQFRIHGQAPKELYGSQWSATGKANMLAADTLHYRLIPYIYSLAWRTTNEGYTIMRHLVFDFQKDTSVYGISDQFMYGPALLVSPVTTAGATSRSVYLPAGTWYNFWTGATVAGGSKTTAEAPLSQIPIFVRGGSIVPMGPKIQYATESADPLEIRIYKGANATFTLYEDEGDNYNYETGKYATIKLTWDDAAGKLTIGAREGSFTGMLATRTFNIVWVGANKGAGIDVAATPDESVKYDGTETSVSAK